MQRSQNMSPNRQAAVQSVRVPSRQKSKTCLILKSNYNGREPREYWVFVLMRRRTGEAGSTPSDIARDIERAKSAVRILLR